MATGSNVRRHDDRRGTRGQRTEIRGQRKMFKLISDLRLLTSRIDDFNGFNQLTNC